VPFTSAEISIPMMLLQFTELMENFITGRIQRKQVCCELMPQKCPPVFTSSAFSKMQEELQEK
jgi:hypothetical protein